MVTMKQQLVASRAKTSAGTNGRKYITIHETANTSRGANAQVHANLQSRGFTASWHWQVDDKEAIQSFQHTVRCWHGGDGTGNGNFNSIGIEICVNSDGDFKKAVENAAALVKHIMKQEGIPLSNVVQHNKWSGKNCPTNLRNGSKGINWNGFIGLVKGSPSTVKASSPSTQGESLVDYLNAKGQDASFAARAKLAAAYGIPNYSGTAAQNIQLLAELKKSTAKPAEPKPAPKPVTPVSKPKEEEDMLKQAIVIGSLNDYAAAEVLSIRKGIPIFPRKSIKGEVAKELIIVGGDAKGLKADKITNLSGGTRFETAKNVEKYL